VREEDKYASKSGATVHDELAQRTTEGVNQKLQFPEEGCYGESHEHEEKS
jgi:hypothetical protein